MTRWKKCRAVGFVTALLLSACCRGSIAATPAEIEHAIQRGKDFLYGEEKGGTWELAGPPGSGLIKSNPSDVLGGQYGGLTALSVYALLTAGESYQDPRLAPPIKFLESYDFKGTYALGVKAQLYTLLPTTPERRKYAKADFDKLSQGLISQGAPKGLYVYLLNYDANPRFDHSASQYGALGMWALERSGIEVPSRYWQTVEAAWLRDQDASGGWTYDRNANPDHGVTMAMTAAGVATLFVTQDYLHADAGVRCTGNISNANIDAGLKWIASHIDQMMVDDRQPFMPWYALYAIERIGVASGLKYFGTTNWYDVGADFIVKHQLDNGCWPGGVPSTSFALLFLSRGRAPVVFNKLQYDLKGKPGNWNQRPRDIANVTRWIGKQTERDLNWQIVNLAAPVNELQEAPILYLSGNEALQFNAAEQAKLKQFCEEGGLILGQADCDKTTFSTGFKNLGKQLFPTYEFKELPASHPIFTNEQYARSKMKPVPTVSSLGNGVRELMILMNTGDAGKFWQMQDSAGHLSQFQLAADIVSYIVDKQHLLEKGKTYQVEANPAMKPTRQAKLARLQYTGNWDPEPAGWRRLANILHNTADTNLEVESIKLGENKLAGMKVAHITGTDKFILDEASRAEIKKFIESGGTLIVDAAGGSTGFAQSAEAELTAIFGTALANQLNAPLPATAKIYDLSGQSIRNFEFRQFAKQSLGVKGAQLRGITIQDRLAVFYSREDLSAALVGEPRDGLLGYEPATATVIMRNLITFAVFGS